MSTRSVLAAVLVFEAIVLWLFVPVAATVADVSLPVALAIGAGLGVACIVVAGMLGRPWGVTAGWVLQVVVVSLGFVVPAMFVVGGIFGLLWFTTFRVGRHIDELKAARENRPPEGEGQPAG